MSWVQWAVIVIIIAAVNTVLLILVVETSLQTAKLRKKMTLNIIFHIRRRNDDPSMTSLHVTMAQKRSVLPGGGMMIRTKIPVMISPRSEPESVQIIGDGDLLKLTDQDQFLDMIQIKRPNGRQCQLHTTVAAYWTQESSAKEEAMMKLIPGECNSMGSRITFLMVEIGSKIEKKEALEVLNLKDVVNWILVCEDRLLQAETNTARRLFKSLSSLAENAIAEFYGPTSLDMNTSPMKVLVARELVENTNIFGNQLTSMLFETFTSQTVKVITKVDEDTALAVLVTTMTAWKFQKFGIAKWKEVTKVNDYQASWPELMKTRK